MKLISESFRKMSGTNLPPGLLVLLLVMEIVLNPAMNAGDHPGPPHNTIGVLGQTGCLSNPVVRRSMVITQPGIYENYLVDGEWSSTNLVKVKADNVTLRHFEVRNSLKNGITLYAKNTIIENSIIHHLLAGTFDEQDDAHGITGEPLNLTIRNCEIYLVSGDCLQFAPGRGPWNNVVIENCTFWTAPLPEDAAGFKKGERPGENALDTKNWAANPRSKVSIRNCLMYGWGDGQIERMAALNLKENVEVEIENCIFKDNELCFRLRGGEGKKGGARVTIRDCTVYDSRVALRMEDKIKDLKVFRLGIGAGIQQKYKMAGGGVGEGYVNEGEYIAPPYEELLKNGF